MVCVSLSRTSLAHLQGGTWNNVACTLGTQGRGDGFAHPIADELCAAWLVSLLASCVFAQFACIRPIITPLQTLCRLNAEQAPTLCCNMCTMHLLTAWPLCSG